jgi:hypothetical protein
MSLLKEHLDENNLQFIKRVRNPSLSFFQISVVLNVDIEFSSHDGFMQ